MTQVLPELVKTFSVGTWGPVPIYSGHSVEEVGRSYRISRHHLVKVVAALTELGVVESRRGRGGGMKLAMEPSRINLGWLVRETEPHFKIVECFDLATNTCPIAPACGLKGALLRAQQAFLEVLDGYTIDSFRARRAELVVEWTAQGA